MSLRMIAAAARLQLRLVRRDVETISPLFTMPLSTIVSMAIFVHSGRADLAGYAICASFLITVGQMALFNSSEVVTGDRSHQRLELMIAAPQPYVVIVAVRTLILTSMGLVGFVEAWLIIHFLFGVTVQIHHPIVLALTLTATAFSAGCTAVLTAALFSLTTNVRTVQNAVNGPFYLLGGVLVPTRYLPYWLQPLGPFIFFYWSANLVRDSLSPAPLVDLPARFGWLLGLGLLTGVAGVFVMRRMLDQLRRSGKMGLA